MATWSRRERVTRTVEYTVPVGGDGAAYAEIQKAITAARQDLTEAGRADSFGTIADNEIRVLPGDDEIIVAYEVDDTNTDSMGYNTIGWAVWDSRGALYATVKGHNTAGDAFGSTAKGKVLPWGAAKVVGWHVESVNARELHFLEFYLKRVEASRRDGARTHWRRLMGHTTVDDDTLAGELAVEQTTQPVHGWALWYPHGGLHEIETAERAGGDVGNAWLEIAATTGFPAAKIRADGWHLDPLTLREFTFIARPEVTKAFRADGSRDAWLRLVDRDACVRVIGRQSK
jgi:hypothetical protein